EVLLPTVAAPTSGTYTLKVSGASNTTGLFTARLTLNAALEAEEHGGPRNDTRATAQDLEPSAVALPKGASRLAVLVQGDGPASSDFYSFHLDAGQKATLGLKALGQGSVNLELQDATGTVLATGTAGAANVDKAIELFTAPAAGTYFTRISTNSLTDYSL